VIWVAPNKTWWLVITDHDQDAVPNFESFIDLWRRITAAHTINGFRMAPP